MTDDVRHRSLKGKRWGLDTGVISLLTRETHTHVVMPARISVWLVLVSDEDQVKRLKTYEEARTSSLIGNTRPLEFKPTTDERIGHLYESTINSKIIARRNIGVRRH
jgi:hypothetical protein